jgi:hypothetical protein
VYVPLHVMVRLLVEVQPPKAKLTFFCDTNCFLIGSTVSAYSLRSMLLRVLGYGFTRSFCKVVCDHCSLRCDIASQGLESKPNPNMR